MRVSVTLLQYEHGVIRQVIDVFGEIMKHDTLDKHRKQAAKIVEFLDSYMDAFHHGKEEKFMFPAAVRAVQGMGPTVEMLVGEHKEARALLADLKEQCGAKIPDKRRFIKTATRLVEHVTSHIKKEENEVFPRIEEVLSNDEDTVVMMQFMSFGTTKFPPEFGRAAEDFSMKVQDEVLGPGYWQGIR
jgi:hemerythrin-like domain-containing protein